MKDKVGDSETEMLLGTHIPENDRLTNRRWGQLHIQSLLSDQQLWFRHRYLPSEESGDNTENELESEPWEDEKDWIRWPLKAPLDKIIFEPVTPDLPYVIQSKYPIHLPPGHSVKVLVSIPAWVKIGIEAGERHDMLELSTVPLQKTWFGTPLDGELCYWRETQAIMGWIPQHSPNHYIHCPIRIKNNSDEILNFTKFNFRVEALTLFEHKDRLWGDETRINFKGQEITSDIDITGKLPAELKMHSAEIVAEPRKSAKRSITRRTFNFLLNI